MNVLVTGVGAIIGYGILRSLRKMDQDIRLIGADIFSDAVGQAWVDHFVLAPFTSNDFYSDWLENTLVENKIDLVIPGIEQDLHYFSDHRDLFARLNVRVALNDQRLVNLTRDKWLMHQELKNINSETRIPSYLEGEFDSLAEKLSLPFILKPRQSYASKGLVRVYNKADFLVACEKLGTELLAQPIIGTDEEEYTVAVFGDGTGSVCASIALQRKLASDGSTAKAWVRQDDRLDQAVYALCSHFKPVGPTNLQFRKEGDNWYLLEINPRISSTTSIRTLFGYNEAEMCVQFFLMKKKVVQPVVTSGFAARFIEDHVIYDRDHF